MNDATQLDLENVPRPAPHQSTVPAREATVRVKGLNLFYDEVQALNNIELDSYNFV